MNNQKITSREKEVAQYIKKGLSNNEIAKLLGISSHTVKAHTINLFKKMGAKNRIHLAYIIGCQENISPNYL